MKKLTLWIICLSVLSTRSLVAQNRKDIIINYENVQGGIVGKTLSTFQNGQALFGAMIPDIITKDEPSSSEQTKELNKKLTIGLSTIFKANNLKNIKVEATDVQITNVNNNVETLPTGSRIIMSAFKAETLIITMTKNRNYNLSLNQFMDKIKKYVPVSDASVLNALNLIDSANYQNNSILKIVIKNPNVYYAFIVGQIKYEYAIDAYLDIPTSGLHGNTTIKLNTSSDRIYPKTSKTFRATGYPKHIIISARLNEAGEPELQVQVTKQGGGVDTTILFEHEFKRKITAKNLKGKFFIFI